MKTLLRFSIPIALLSISQLALAQNKDEPPTPKPAPTSAPQSTWGTGQDLPPPPPDETPPDSSADTQAAPVQTQTPPSQVEVHEETTPAIRYVPTSMNGQAAVPSSAPESSGVPSLQDHDTRRSFWKIGMGVRAGRIDNAGFDPFAENSQLWQYSLTATRTLLATRRFSFAAGASWDVGQRDDTESRGFKTGIAVHRLSVPLEARFHAASWLYVFGRVAPGADYRKAWITDPSSSTGELDSSAWAPAADFSLGASFLAGPQGKPDSHVPRFWFSPEFGYAWSGATDLAFAPKGASDDPQPTGTTNLGELALRGPFARMSVDLSF
ncbi:MAG: hypothetical protein ACRELY_06765 [Polyangiaceae bacterium]